MKKFIAKNNLLKKEVISIFDAEVCGKVDNLFLKDFKLFGLEIKKDNLKFFVPRKAIFCISKTKVMIKNKSFLSVSNPSTNLTFLGKKVFSIFGKCFGKILNITFLNNFVVKNFVTKKAKFSKNQILSFADIVLLKTNLNQNKYDFAKKLRKKCKKTQKNNSKTIILPKK